MGNGVGTGLGIANHLPGCIDAGGVRVGCVIGSGVESAVIVELDGARPKGRSANEKNCEGRDSKHVTGMMRDFLRYYRLGPEDDQIFQGDFSPLAAPHRFALHDQADLVFRVGQAEHMPDRFVAFRPFFIGIGIHGAL